MSTVTKKLSAEQKLRIVMDVAARPGDPLQAFLEREGVTVQELHLWCRIVEGAAIEALSAELSADFSTALRGRGAAQGVSTQAEMDALRYRTRELEAELNRTRNRLEEALEKLAHRSSEYYDKAENA